VLITVTEGGGPAQEEVCALSVTYLMGIACPVPPVSYFTSVASEGGLKRRAEGCDLVVLQVETPALVPSPSPYPKSPRVHLSDEKIHQG